MTFAPRYVSAALAAAKTRTWQAGACARLSHADRDDLHQELLLDLLERAERYDASRGSLGTFTGLLTKHRVCDFLNSRSKDRTLLVADTGYRAANDPGPADDLDVDALASDLDRDLFTDGDTLHDLAVALGYMGDEQAALLALIETHGELPSACTASGLSTATFYRRVADLRMHLRMFGLRPAA